MSNRISDERDLARFLLSRIKGVDRIVLGGVLLGKLSIVVFDLAGIFLVGAVLAAATGTVISQDSFMGRVLSFVGEVGFSSAPAGLLLFAILFFCIKAVFSVVLSAVTGRYSARVELATSKELFRSLLSVGFRTSYIQNAAKTSLALTTGTSTLVSQSLVTLTTIVGESFLVLSIAASLAVTNLLLFLTLTTFFTAVIYVLHHLVAKRAVSSANTIHKTNLGTQTLILDVLSNFRFIATTNAQEDFGDKFALYRKANSDEFAKYQLTTSLPRYVLEVSVMIGASLIFLAVAIFGAEIIPAATVGIYVAGLFRLVSAILPLQSALVTWSRIEVESKPTRELSRELSVLAEKQLTSDEIESNSHVAGLAIHLKEVSFSYDKGEPPILIDANMNVSPGQFVAVVGESGAGKSTLADLILGLHLPSQGSVKLDGISAQAFRISGRGLVAYMPQETKLIAGTLFENISFSFETPSSVDLGYVSTLLGSVGLGSLERDLPQGLLTVRSSKASCSR
jgi:ATP-binding cassette subfamily C protein